LKKINFKVLVYWAAQAWGEISKKHLQNCGEVIWERIKQTN
jgi:hypothetical protein